MSSKQERDMVNSLHKKRVVESKVEREFELFKELIPAIRAAVRAGGGADAVLKKSETIAAMELLKATQSEKDEVRLKAATEILNRTIGKPVERSISIYGDIAKMNERDVDNQILQLLEKTGAKQLMSSTLGIPTRKPYKRKPRKSDPLVIEAEVIPTPRSQSPAETGTPPAAKD